jgi:hypothetical protein
MRLNSCAEQVPRTRLITALFGTHDNIYDIHALQLIIL